MSFRDEIREQAVEDAWIEATAKSVIALMKRKNMSLDDALNTLEVDPVLEPDVRFLAKQGMKSLDIGADTES